MENTITIGKQPLKLWHGVTVCLLSSIIAELAFRKFLPEVILTNSIARVLILFISLFTIHFFATLSIRSYGRRLKDLLFIHSALAILIGIVAITRFIIGAVITQLHNLEFGGVLSENILFFLIPFAMGGLLIQAVLGMSHALVFALNLSIIAGFYFPDAKVFIPFVLITNLAASLSLRRFRSRGDYVKAGLYVALFSFPFAIASLITSNTLDFAHISIAFLVALIGGVACSFLATGITPVVEHLCGYVTDMRLIEMATLDHPILKELSLSAPGTWNHSMVIGMMVEAAADAIGANSVLARVGAYFHDVGKSKKPLYFVENQSGGENRHDKLSTSMSALIIRSHVKDGIDLARKYKLPEPVIDIIAQHHGTSLIEYFYDKATKETAETGTETTVDRSLYAYPGPKPQSREAAILMLADGVEAASRTISDPTPDRIQGMVQKMINKVFASGELNECELTLKDLHFIAKTFNRVLNGIYHQRIAYAEPAEKTAEKQAATATDVTDEPLAKNEEKAEKQKPQEDLKRLGI